MLYSYRITKYFKLNTKGNLISSDDEWSSFSDVGGNISFEEYIKVENAYLGVITSACEYLCVSKLKVAELEFIDSDRHIVDGQLLTVDNARELAKSILREELWCKLTSKNIEFHFGYDFYMYLVSTTELSELFKKNDFTNILNIQEFKSPYI